MATTERDDAPSMMLRKCFYDETDVYMVIGKPSPVPIQLQQNA